MIDSHRLARIQAAERRANWRDRELRYGNQYRSPAIVKRPPHQKRSGARDTWPVVWLLLICAVLLMAN